MKAIDAVWKYMDVSTSHVTPNDCDLLDDDALPLVVYRFAEGYWILVPEDFEETEEEIFRCGGSAFLVDVLELAMNLGCYWVKLDRDGCEIDELKIYNW